MSDYDKTGEQMLQIDPKRRQRELNYRRAEAFLLWKFGKNYDHVRDFLRGSGMDWPSLFVEFVEKVEEDLLARVSYVEEQYYKSINLAMSSSVMPFVYPDAKGKTTAEFFTSPPMGYAGNAREPLRRHWTNNPSAYSDEELKKFKEEDDGERQ